MDDGTCTKFDQSCVPGSSRSESEGFAASDKESAWYGIKRVRSNSHFYHFFNAYNRKSIRIPLFLVLKEDWDKLLARWTFSPEQERQRNVEELERERKEEEDRNALANAKTEL